MTLIVINRSSGDGRGGPNDPAPDRSADRSGVPASRDGADVIGKRLPLDGLRWLNAKDERPPEIEGKVTLVRWWTDACPFCERSLPAIARIDETFGPRGLQSIAVYHAKPPRAVPDEQILSDAAERSFEGTVAVDEDWRTLRAFYLSSQPRQATSVTFLLDQQGKVRFVHPGPEFRPTDDPRLGNLNRDYEDVRRAIEVLLAEVETQSPTGK